MCPDSQAGHTGRPNGRQRFEAQLGMVRWANSRGQESSGRRSRMPMDIRLFLEWKPPWIGGRQLILKKAPNGTAWTIALAHALRRPAQDRREQRVHLRDIESLMMELIKHRRQPEDHLPVDIFAPNFHQKSPNDPRRSDFWSGGR